MTAAASGQRERVVQQMPTALPRLARISLMESLTKLSKSASKEFTDQLRSSIATRSKAGTQRCGTRSGEMHQTFDDGLQSSTPRVHFPTRSREWRFDGVADLTHPSKTGSLNTVANAEIVSVIQNISSTEISDMSRSECQSAWTCGEDR